MDLPLMAEAVRLKNLAAKFPDSPFLAQKLAQAKSVHDAASVYLAVWLQTGNAPSMGGNPFLDKAVQLAQSVLALDVRKVVSIETFGMTGRPDGVSRFGKVHEPVQHRVSTTAYSLNGSAVFAEAGGLSDSARREAAKVRAGSGQYKGARRVASKSERARLVRLPLANDT